MGAGLILAQPWGSEARIACGLGPSLVMLCTTHVRFSGGLHVAECSLA